MVSRKHRECLVHASDDGTPVPSPAMVSFALHFPTASSPVPLIVRNLWDHYCLVCCDFRPAMASLRIPRCTALGT